MKYNKRQIGGALQKVGRALKGGAANGSGGRPSGRRSGVPSRQGSGGLASAAKRFLKR